MDTAVPQDSECRGKPLGSTNAATPRCRELYAPQNNPLFFLFGAVYEPPYHFADRPPGSEQQIADRSPTTEQRIFDSSPAAKDPFSKALECAHCGSVGEWNSETLHESRKETQEPQKEGVAPRSSRRMLYYMPRKAGVDNQPAEGMNRERHLRERGIHEAMATSP